MRLGEYDLRNDKERFPHYDHRVDRMIVHEKYNSTTVLDDIALLELVKPVTFRKHIVPVCLPKKNSDHSGKTGTLTGWGRTRDEKVRRYLQRKDFKILKDCHRRSTKRFRVADGTLCSDARVSVSGACFGDSGSPLTTMEDGRALIVGVFSSLSSCDAPDALAFYMPVSHYVEWIEAKMRT